MDVTVRKANYALSAALLAGVLLLCIGFATSGILSRNVWFDYKYLEFEIVPLVVFSAVFLSVGALLFLLRQGSMSGLAALLAVYAVLAFGPAAFVAFVCLTWVSLTLGSLALGRADDGEWAATEPEPCDKVLRILLRTVVGYTLLALALNVLLAFPIHDIRVYAVVFGLLVVSTWRLQLALFRDVVWLCEIGRSRPTLATYLVYLIAALLLAIQLTYAALPERYYDALVLHLHVAKTVATTGRWHFAGDFLVVANTTVSADWLFAVAYVMAGEPAAKLLNFGFLVVSFVLTYVVCLKHAGRWPALLATLMLVTSPLSFMEAATAWVDNNFTMTVTSTIALVSVWETLGSRARVIACATLIGGMPSAKLHGLFSSFAFAMVILYKKLWRDIAATSPTVLFVVIVVGLLSVAPFAMAYYVTGNPIMPLFNALFHSPYYVDDVNFAGSYPGELGLLTLYKQTFYTSKYFQGADGAFGFQVLAFGMAAVVVGVVRADDVTRSSLFITVLYIMPVLSMTTEARYLYPMFGLVSILTASALGMLEYNAGKGAISASRAAVAAVAVANFLYFPGAGWILPSFRPSAVFDQRQKDTLIAAAVPQRILNEHVNSTYGAAGRVVYLGQPVGYPLAGVPLYASWYMWGVQKGLLAIDSESAAREWLQSIGATHVILPISQTRPASEAALVKYLAADAELEKGVGNFALFRLRNAVMHPTRLSSPENWARWARPGGTDRDLELSLADTDPITFNTPDLAQGQTSLAISFRAACVEQDSTVAVQVYWIRDRRGLPIAATQSVPCFAGKPTDADLVFERPKGTTSASVYVVNSKGRAVIGNPSVSTTRISLAGPASLYERGEIGRQLKLLQQEFFRLYYKVRLRFS